MITRIVLALDGSPESDYAVPITQELALATAPRSPSSTCAR